jgi:hypothetical protein
MMIKNNIYQGEMYEKNKRFLFISATLISLMLLSTNVFADVNMLSYGYPTPTIKVKAYSYNSTWQVPMDQSLTNWVNTPTKINVYKISQSDNTISAFNSADTYYGINYPTVSGSTLTKFRIELNSRTISGDATNFSIFVQSVLVHELGHSMWLADANTITTSNSTIMQYARNRNIMSTPQYFDIVNINGKY